MSATKSDETDGFYRSALQAIRGKKLPEAFENILRKEVCTKIGTSVANENIEVLTQTLSDSNAIIQDIILPCIEEEGRSPLEKRQALQLARRLSQNATLKKENRIFSEKLFDLSLKHSRDEAIEFSQRLASSAVDQAQLSSVTFWKSVSKPDSIWAQDAIKTYRKFHKWTDLDEARYKLFTKKSALKTKTMPPQKVEILAEKATQANAIDLSDYRPLPQLSLGGATDLDFYQAFIDEASTPTRAAE